MTVALRSSIVILVDGLRPSMLGAYGNTWFETPHLNRLAAESLLFEFCVTDSPNLALGRRSIFRGQHSLQSHIVQPHLGDAIGSTGTTTILLTDHDPEWLSEEQARFDQVIPLIAKPGSNLAGEIESTEMATFFAAAVQVIRDLQPPFLLMIDYSGLNRTWDAPYALRKQLSDPDDPPPPKIVEPANSQFNAILDDPDMLLGFSQVYAAQISMLDSFLGIFMDQINRSRIRDDTLVCLTSTRGYPLGEHGVVGHYREILHHESIQVPLLIRWPNRQWEHVRAQSLVQPGLLYPLLCQWHRCDVDVSMSETIFQRPNASNPLPDKRSNLVICGCHSEDQIHHALQTLSWKMIRGVARHLYVFPDDRWEVNDVATRCNQVLLDLDHLLDESIARLDSGGSLCEFPLADDLAFGVA